MIVLKFFENLFYKFGDLINFLNTRLNFSYPAGFVIGGNASGSIVWQQANFTIFDALSISIGGFLVLCLMLHIWHLIKLVF